MALLNRRRFLRDIVLAGIGLGILPIVPNRLTQSSFKVPDKLNGKVQLHSGEVVWLVQPHVKHFLTADNFGETIGEVEVWYYIDDLEDCAKEIVTNELS